MPQFEQRAAEAQQRFAHLTAVAQPIIREIALGEADKVAAGMGRAIESWIDGFIALRGLDLLMTRMGVGVTHDALSGPPISTGPRSWSGWVDYYSFDLPSLQRNAWRSDLRDGARFDQFAAKVRQWAQFADRLASDATAPAPECFPNERTEQ